MRPASRLPFIALSLLLLNAWPAYAADDWVAHFYSLETFETKTFRIPADENWVVPAGIIKGWSCVALKATPSEKVKGATERQLFCSAISADGKRTGHVVTVVGMCVPLSDPVFKGYAGRMLIEAASLNWAIEFDCGTQFDRNRR